LACSSRKILVKTNALAQTW